MKRTQLQIRPIEERIFLVRGQRVMLDTHLAALYGVEVRIRVRNVKRNIDRFPADFMMQLNRAEFTSLRSQFGILKEGRGQHRKYLPYVFTEQGVAMLSSVLNSKRAIHVNIHIMRAFVKIRGWISTHRDLHEKIKKLERRFDRKFAVVFRAIQSLLDGPRKPVRVKGFAPARKGVKMISPADDQRRECRVRRPNMAPSGRHGE